MELLLRLRSQGEARRRQGPRILSGPNMVIIMSFSGHPGKAERAGNLDTNITCHRLQPPAAVDVVERLGDEELFRELRSRDLLVKVYSKWFRKEEGLAMLSVESLQLPFPRIRRPFLWEEGGQLLVCHEYRCNLGWRNGRGLVSGGCNLGNVIRNHAVGIRTCMLQYVSILSYM